MPRRFHFEQLPRTAQKLGMGRIPRMGTGMGGLDQDKMRFIGQVQQAIQAPAYVLPNVETVRWHFNGPLHDNDCNATFGASIDILGSGRNNPPPGCDSVESTMAKPGEFQTWALILAIGIHLEPEPQTFVIKGNSLTPVPITGTASPVSPDAFVVTDLASGGTLGLTFNSGQQQNLTPALLQWAYWTERAFWHMTRAYNTVWQWGQSTTLVNDSLQYTAYTPGNAMNGSASSSEVDVFNYIRQTNQYYFETLNTNAIFLPIDRTRIGNMTIAGTEAQSVYRPSRAYETVGATIGGMGLRDQLRGNHEWRKLSSPFLMKPGVPIGLRMDVKNTTDMLFMQQQLSASHLLNGNIPADFTVFTNINMGPGVPQSGPAGLPVGAEPSLDNPVAPEPLQTITDRVIYKGGTWKMTLALKGFELTDDQANLVQTDANFRAALFEGCGCSCPQA